MAEASIVGICVATADPELKTVGENSTVCTVNLAFNRSYKDKDNEWQNEPCFLRAQVWGNRANKMFELVKKGQPLYVNGYLKQDTWTDKDSGKKRTSHSVTLRDFQLCVKTGKQDGAKNTGNTNTSTTKPQEAAPVGNDDVPF